MDLPDDIISEILVRMPAKEVGRCKLLSREWNGRISNHQFVKMHLMQMRLQNRVSICNQPEHCFIPLQYMLNRRVVRKLEYIGSCDNLVLLCNTDDVCYLLNPTTNHGHVLPNEYISFPPHTNGASVVFGVGYNTSQDDYQVVRVGMFHSFEFQNEVKIYSRNMNQWRRLPDFPYRIVPTPGVYANGCLHWMLYSDHIVALNLSDDSFRLMSLPLGLHNRNSGFRHYSLGALNGVKICVYSTLYMFDESNDVWMLDDYSNDKSWERHRIVLDVPMRNIFRIISFQPLYLMEPARDKIVFRINPLGTYGILDMKAQRFHIDNGVHLANYDSRSFPFVEAL